MHQKGSFLETYYGRDRDWKPRCDDEILTLLESVVKRDFLVSDFETTSELLAFGNLGGVAFNDAANPEITAVLPWIPQTTSSVTLRLMELDTSICYSLQQKEDFEKNRARQIITISSRSSVTRNSSEPLRPYPLHTGNVPKDTWDGPGIEHNSSGRRGGRVSIRVGFLSIATEMVEGEES